MNKKPITWTNCKVKLGDLKPWDHNPRKSTKEQADRILKSMDEFGQVDVFAIGPDNEVYNGHQRLGALLIKYGKKHGVDARRASRKLSEQERKKLTAFLHAGATGGWDWNALESWNANELQEWGMDKNWLKSLKLDMNEFISLIESQKPETMDAEPQIDKSEYLLKKWECKRGQLWKLGNLGYLYCGDAASSNIVCDFAIYDPPFEWSTQQQENSMMWITWKNALLLGLKNCFPLILRSDCNHWWVWDSGMARFGGKGYKPMSGCAMALSFGDKLHWYEDAAIAICNNEGIPHHAEYPTQYIHIQDHLGGMDRKRDEKPNKLYKYIISLYSLEGEIIGDPFAGSGGLVDACVQMKRKYYGAEINLNNCAVILERFYKLIGVYPNCVEEYTLGSHIQSEDAAVDHV